MDLDYPLFVKSQAITYKMAENYTYIDLFAGCGGLSLGLHNAGWKGLFAIEKGEDSFKTLRHNLIDNKKHFSWVKWLKPEHHDIEEVIKKHKRELKSLRGKVHMVTGGPPCQGFSIAGRRNEGDERNKLIKSYIYFIGLVQPKIIFFENVRGFTLTFRKNKEKGKKYSDYVKERLDKAGYHVHGKLINFAEYGVPQKRTRFILVGIRKDVPESSAELAEDFFKKLNSQKTSFLFKKNLSVDTNLEDAISDLLQRNGTEPSLDTNNFQAGIYSKPSTPYQVLMRKEVDRIVADSHRFANHSNKIKERLLSIINDESVEKNKDIGKGVREKIGIKKHSLTLLSKDDKSPTLTTLPDDYIHYLEPRILTVREYARIQSFPDWYEFKGKYTTGGNRRRVEVPRYTQIGNAIPPLFGELSGLVLKKLI